MVVHLHICGTEITCGGWLTPKTVGIIFLLLIHNNLKLLYCFANAFSKYFNRVGLSKKIEFERINCMLKKCKNQ